MNGGMAGDLIIKLKVEEDKYFRREGFDIYTEVPLNVSEAVLGTKIKAKTIHGLTKISIPSGTQHGSKIKLPG